MTTDNFGYFNVETRRDGTNVISSYLIAVILVVIAGGLGWAAFLPLDSYSYTSTGKQCARTQDCAINQSCVNNMCSTTQKTTKKPIWFLIISFVLIFFAYLIARDAGKVKKIIVRDKNTRDLLVGVNILSNMLKK